MNVPLDTEHIPMEVFSIAVSKELPHGVQQLGRTVYILKFPESTTFSEETIKQNICHGDMPCKFSLTYFFCVVENLYGPVLLDNQGEESLPSTLLRDVHKHFLKFRAEVISSTGHQTSKTNIAFVPNQLLHQAVSSTQAFSSVESMVLQWKEQVVPVVPKDDISG